MLSDTRNVPAFTKLAASMALSLAFISSAAVSDTYDDFDAVEYDAPAFDAQLGLDGLHRVHKKVEPRPRQTIIPPDLFERYSQLSFWQNLPNSAAYRIVVQKNEPQQATMPEPKQQIDVADQKLDSAAGAAAFTGSELVESAT